MDSRHPGSVRDITNWCKKQRLPTRTGRLRFAQREVLRAIGNHGIGKQIAFKGGNALRILHRNPRGTLDLDFTASESVPDEADWIRQQIQASLDAIPPDHGIKMRVQRVRRQPPGENATTPTYSVGIGFCLEGDRGFIARHIEEGRAMNEVVEVEISINDVICESSMEPLQVNSKESINSCTLDDILGEKLRSLLQQPIRNRSRPQDVYDIAKQWRDRPEMISLERVAECLIVKCRARDIEPHRSSFDDEIRKRAEVDYDRIRVDTRDAFIPFEMAWASVIELVEQLGLPK